MYPVRRFALWCSFVTKIKATLAKPSRSKKTVEEEAEVEEEITPPKAKSKGILGALSGRLKRKQGDRSPGEEPSNNPPSRSSVRVIVPLPPRPLSDYVQLGARLSQPPFASSHIASIRSNYEEREHRAQAAFELERAQFCAQFDELSRELREIRERERRAGGSSRYGEGSRRG